MFASSNYPPDAEAADRFVAEMRHGTLIACPPGGYPQVSILPFVKTDDVIEIHCVQEDPTFGAVQANPSVTFFVSDYLAWSPHSWVDERDAGRATLHFRAVAFECNAERVSTERVSAERVSAERGRAPPVVRLPALPDPAVPVGTPAMASGGEPPAGKSSRVVTPEPNRGVQVGDTDRNVVVRAARGFGFAQ